MEFFSRRIPFADTFDLASSVEDAAATGNTLSVHLASGLGSTHSDATRLRQMLLNLLGNAAKLTTGGRITLFAARAAGQGSVFAILLPATLPADGNCGR